MNKMEVSTIGERIKTLRKKRGYNQKDLANLLGKSLRTIQKYESGEIEVSIAMVNELAKVLDTTSTYLLGHQTGDFKFDCLSDVMEWFVSTGKNQWTALFHRNKKTATS